MNKPLLLLQKRNVLMAKIIWLFLFLSVAVNTIVDPSILVIIIPTGLFSCTIVTVFVRKKWFVHWTPYLIVTAIYFFFIALVIYEPLLINFIYIWFALILSSIYQKGNPIFLAGCYSFFFTIYAFYKYKEEIFYFCEQEDLVYIALFSILVTIFLIFASKFNTAINDELEREKRETEEMLRRSEKLAVVGQLAAGVAHEIRNPLAVISGFIQLLKKEHKTINYYDIMLKELDRINLIISEFLVLSKPQVSLMEVKDLNKILNEVYTLISTHALMKNIHLQSQRLSDQLLVRCEENQMKQVLINVYKNAIEAMSDGGFITTEVSTENGFVFIKIIDNGVGISNENLAKLGEPFFTTKEVGTGLGLMVSLKIIENHLGKLSFKSIVGKGTTVEITLPLVNKGGDLK